MKYQIKLALIVIFAVFTGCVGLQQVKNTDNTFNVIVEAPKCSKEQIFNGTKIWIAENFSSAKAVLEYENKDSGIIIGNGAIPYPCSGLECMATGAWKIPFTMRVDIKDQRFRLTFSNIKLVCPPSNSGMFVSSGYNGPINTQSRFDSVKLELLEFGNEVLCFLSKENNQKDW